MLARSSFGVDFPDLLLLLPQWNQFPIFFFFFSHNETSSPASFISPPCSCSFRSLPHLVLTWPSMSHTAIVWWSKRKRGTCRRISTVWFTIRMEFMARIAQSHLVKASPTIFKWRIKSEISPFSPVTGSSKATLWFLPFPDGLFLISLLVRTLSIVDDIDIVYWLASW